jgi:hypothetical protein
VSQPYDGRRAHFRHRLLVADIKEEGHKAAVGAGHGGMGGMY